MIFPAILIVLCIVLFVTLVLRLDPETRWTTWPLFVWTLGFIPLAAFAVLSEGYYHLRLTYSGMPASGDMGMGSVGIALSAMFQQGAFFVTIGYLILFPFEVLLKPKRRCGSE